MGYGDKDSLHKPPAGATKTSVRKVKSNNLELCWLATVPATRKKKQRYIWQRQRQMRSMIKELNHATPCKDIVPAIQG
jgi:hypothetical protein